MKRMNLSWDLKPGKKVTFQTYWAGIGYKDGLVTLKEYKITDAEQDGYKKLTFTGSRYISGKLSGTLHRCRRSQ